MFLESGILPSPYFSESPVWIPAAGGGGGGGPFITGFASLDSLRNDYGLGVGFYFTVGAANITVTHLGRLVISGNSGTHVITIYSSTSIGDAIGNVTVDTSGETPGDFVYAALGSPLTLLSGNTYYILSDEDSGGDQWYNNGTLPTVSGDATLIGSCYDYGGGIGTPTSNGTAYVTPNFLYTL